MTSTGVKHVFIIGAKGLSGYGGYETFVRKLLEHTPENGRVRYHVTCKANGYGAMKEDSLDSVSWTGIDDFLYRGAHCHKVFAPAPGSAQAVLYDFLGLCWAMRYCRKEKISHPVFYVLSCRLGPVIDVLCHRIHAMGGSFFLNPDGHEWMRKKWNRLIRFYFRFSERRMSLCADRVICDSKVIEQYIRKEYKLPPERTAYLSYGAETAPALSEKAEKRCFAWLARRELCEDSYYLMVCRLVPENSFEEILSAFLKSPTERKLLMVTTENPAYLRRLESVTGFRSDPRILVEKSIYDEELLHGLRRHAHGYLHGHTVGGTNPGLLEAMADRCACLARDVPFNRETAGEGALYWKNEKELCRLIGRVDAAPAEELAGFGEKACARIEGCYRWESIAKQYLDLFTGNLTL